jgi:hypothetical protein
MAYSSTPKMKVVPPPETSVKFYHTILRYIPDGSNLHSHLREKRKFNESCYSVTIIFVRETCVPFETSEAIFITPDLLEKNQSYLLCPYDWHRFAIRYRNI